ncbi:DUF2147 domain-containing protein [Aquimarina aquimarini]|uniref:DUF2147 domain-containing protein n=1 Tax=Aquimarina aquimarini TaxID=1191734 RepID=UPI00131F4703|nr:DUF2147 domain-containing protein [Aquimarina aquimarini]
MKFITILLISCFIISSSTVSPETYIGKWKIEGGSIIEIYKEGDTFFGKIDKRADNPLCNLNGLDNKNPNKELQKRPLLGMIILDQLQYNDGVLSDGTIYNADSGKIYDVKVWINSDDKDICYIRAYKSFLFKTFKATRVTH